MTPDVKPGDRIRLIVQPHDPDPLPPGSEGTVIEVAAQVVMTVEWDSGSRRAVLLPLDHIEVIAADAP